MLKIQTLTSHFARVQAKALDPRKRSFPVAVTFGYKGVEVGKNLVYNSACFRLHHFWGILAA
jgi:hypothetical protein